MITGKTIAKGALAVMAATLLSRLFGFFREMVIAGRFGLTGETDAYLVALALPSGVAMAVAAALSAGTIPVLSAYFINDNRAEANRVTSTVINMAFLGLALVTGLAAAGSAGLIKIMAPGFQGAAADQAAGLMVIMLPGLVFSGLIGITTGFLNARQHFLVPALGPLVSSLLIIGAALLLSPSIGITSLAVGTTAGFACQFLVQLPMMTRRGFRYQPGLGLSHPGVVRVFRLMAPVLAASLVPPLMLMVERGLASGLTAGSITALNYAFRLMQLPLGLFLMAVSVPVFPALSAFAARDDSVRFKDILVKGAGILALIMIPAAAGLIALSVPIVRLLFERGAFAPEDTLPTAYALSFYALALLPMSVRDLLRRSFYARQNSLTPVAVVAIGFLINIGLDFALIRVMGIGGLALGASLAAAAETGILYFLLQRSLGGLPGRALGLMTVKLLAASLVMGLAAFYASRLTGGAADLNTSAGRLLQVGISGLTGLAVYAAAVWLLRVREVREALGMAGGLLKKVPGRSLD